MKTNKQNKQGNKTKQKSKQKQINTNPKRQTKQKVNKTKTKVNKTHSAESSFFFKDYIFLHLLYLLANICVHGSMVLQIFFNIIEQILVV